MLKYRVREENGKFMATIEENGKAVDMVICKTNAEARAAKEGAELAEVRAFANEPKGKKKG